METKLELREVSRFVVVCVVHILLLEIVIEPTGGDYLQRHT